MDPKKPLAGLPNLEFTLPAEWVKAVDAANARLTALTAAINDWNKRLVEVAGGPEAFAKKLAELYLEFAELFCAMPVAAARQEKRESNAFGRLIEYSWFIDPDMIADEFFEISDLVAERREADFDERLIRHFRSRFEQISPELIGRHPSRAAVLSQAFLAHRQGHFNLSVPVFLAQADGISHALLGTYFFRDKQGKRAAAVVKEIAGDLFLESVLRAVSTPGPLRGTIGEWKPGALNRHAVMHGEDAAYGDERNSLKAFSLLNFISYICHLTAERRQAVQAVPAAM